MKTVRLKTWMKKLRLSITIILFMPAFSNTATSQITLKNPVCYGEPIMLACNFTEGCDNQNVTFHWENFSGSWTSTNRDPWLFAPGSLWDPINSPGNGQSYSFNGPGGTCAGEGYATDWFSFEMHFQPPPWGYNSGSVHMTVSPPIIVSGSVNDPDGNPLNGGNVCIFNTIWGVLDTLVAAPIVNGQFSFSYTCGIDSPLLVIPDDIGLQTMIPTYLGDTASWMDATIISASSSINVGTIHMIRKPEPVLPGAAAIVKGHVYDNSYAKANDPIDNVGVVIKKTANSILHGYGISDENGFFTIELAGQGEFSIFSDYPGIPMYTLNGANNIYSFNPYDTIILNMMVVAIPLQTESNFIRVYPSYVILPSCAVKSEVVNNGMIKCYDALQNLTVAGTSSEAVIVHNGGNSYFVAGEKINFKPGFRAEIGASMWGHITTTGQFCNQLLGSNLSLGGMTISGNDNRCFQSTGTISVGGDEKSFQVESGSAVHLIAGQKISMFPDAIVVPGAYLHAYISSNGDYCNNPQAPVSGKDSNGSAETTGVAVHDQNTFFKLYPNPTSDSFTLELSSDPGESGVYIRCYDLMGSLIMEKAFHKGIKHELSLAGHASGIYLLRVMMEGETGIEKIIKQN
jgi:hypothetical protein